MIDQTPIIKIRTVNIIGKVHTTADRTEMSEIERIGEIRIDQITSIMLIIKGTLVHQKLIKVTICHP